MTRFASRNFRTDRRDGRDNRWPWQDRDHTVSWFYTRSRPTFPLGGALARILGGAHE